MIYLSKSDEKTIQELKYLKNGYIKMHSYKFYELFFVKMNTNWIKIYSINLLPII